MKRIVMILARMGSRRFAKKKLCPFGGTPLIVRAICKCLAAGMFAGATAKFFNLQQFAAHRELNPIYLAGLRPYHHRGGQDANTDQEVAPACA